jgi:hypothetical protein
MASTVSVKDDKRNRPIQQAAKVSGVHITNTEPLLFRMYSTWLFFHTRVACTGQIETLIGIWQPEEFD